MGGLIVVRYQVCPARSLASAINSASGQLFFSMLSQVAWQDRQISCKFDRSNARSGRRRHGLRWSTTAALSPALPRSVAGTGDGHIRHLPFWSA